MQTTVVYLRLGQDKYLFGGDTFSIFYIYEILYILSRFFLKLFVSMTQCQVFYL